MKIIGNKRNGGRITFNNCGVCIGDIVRVMDAGEQYSSYISAFQHFWGGDKNYYIPYGGRRNRYKSNVKLSDRENTWIVKNMALHGDHPEYILLHLRSRDFKNVVLGIQGVKVIRPLKVRPKEFEIEQL